MKSEFETPTYLNIGEPEPPRIPAAFTIEEAGRILKLALEDVMKFINEGRLRVCAKELSLPGANTMTLFVEGQGVVELLRQKRSL